METRFLAPLLDRPGPWASVYLDTSRATQDAADQLRLRARAAAESLTAQGADPYTRDAVLRHLAAEPAAGSPPGRALFAAGAEVVLDVPLAVSPASVTAGWSTLPRLAPLLDHLDHAPACLVARIDTTGAEIEVADAGGRRRVAHTDGAAWRGRGHRSLPADRQEWHYRHRIENSWARTAEIIAGSLARHWSATGAQLLVLAGDARERHAVLHRLPEQIRARTTETERGSRHRGASADSLDYAVAEARDAYVHHRLQEALDHFRAARGRPGEHVAPGAEAQPGQAAEGIPAVVEAARTHRLATLLLATSGADPAHEVWVGPAPDDVAVRRTEARATGVRRPQPARADDALLRAAAATDAEVLRVPSGPRGPPAAAEPCSAGPPAPPRASPDSPPGTAPPAPRVKDYRRPAGAPGGASPHQ